MEKARSHRKRKRPSPRKPLQGIFTRSRYEIFIKRTRSCRRRTDPNSRRKPSAENRRLRSSGRISIEQKRPRNDAFSDDSLISVKHLRTRRVFSSLSVDGEWSPVKKPKIQTDPDDCGRFEQDDVQRSDGKIFYEEETIDSGGELMQMVSTSVDGRSSESCNAEREVGFDGEENSYNNGIEAISGGVDGVDVECSESGDARRKMIFDREKNSDKEQAIYDNIEAIPGVVDSSVEEWIQRTPPLDGDIVHKPDLREGGGNETGVGTIDTDSVVENPSNARISGDVAHIGEGFVQTKKDATDIMTKNRPALVPCPRIKLFQAPNSLSYRRLLPFLVDLAKDNAGFLEIRSCKNLYSSKFKKMGEERPQPPLLDTQCHVTDLDSGRADMLSRQDPVDDLGTPIIERSVENKIDGLCSALTGAPKENVLDVLSSSGNDKERGKSPDVSETSMKEQSYEMSSDGLGISLTKKSSEASSGSHCLDGLGTPSAYEYVEMCHAVSSVDPSVESQIVNALKDVNTETPIQNDTGNSTTLHDPIFSMLPDLCTETVQQIYQVMSETSCKLDHCIDSIGSMVKTELQCEPFSIPPTCSETLLMECANNIQGSGLPRKYVDECTKLLSASNTDAKLLESLNTQHSSQSDGSYDLETPVLPPTKGILKTRPRECKGLCMCPDCALFRLHAEKGNEFSRKQMQDAEKMALGLMKELSYLRDLMEKIIASGVDSGRDQTVIQVNRIKGFCSRASKAEELARDRLRQMTRNLTTQCRITTLQRPKVRFADNLEQKIILELENEDDG